jgi:hypothetical protein
MRALFFLAELGASAEHQSSTTQRLAKPAKMSDPTHCDMDIDKEVEVQSTEYGKRKAPEAKSKTIHFTSRNPPWTYLKLKL